MPVADIDESALRAAVLPKTDFRAIEVVPRTGSTNADLLGRSGDEPGLVLLAAEQTLGRGRLGRGWSSTPGGLACSALLAPQVATAHWGWLPLLTGVAAVEAIRTVGVSQASLKWPNDVLIDGDKVGGILAERAESARVVVGIGLNVGKTPPDVPQATSLAAAGSTAEVGQVAEAFLLAWDRWLARWAEARGDAGECGLAGAYRAHCSTLGRQVSVTVPGPGPAITGLAEDIDADGRLLVAGGTPGGAGGGPTTAVAAGDVEHVR